MVNRRFVSVSPWIIKVYESQGDLTEAVLFVGKVATIVEMVAVMSFGDASAVGT